MFLAYLRGIETLLPLFMQSLIPGFLAYLRGIETLLYIFFKPVVSWFLAYLRGIETYQEQWAEAGAVI
ncbi:hypothetical protein TTE2649 [Caldanaerobacter subterraneus subsp. tengcongensis MB4]|uniref:Uncharacterized protein n=1 Tax=Caldanaerobacter subterraneus subsp. tengcongensis (strain DSM 15242 / JCM 11007 / NBRC 100824 / MB4) TaxID=273068 RepID=Q8R6Y4_CALS4|nr:hypothetical protein TTE2649 [Caldanaerobacter subterraneus subsp. tengcongensis MB4]